MSTKEKIQEAYDYLMENESGFLQMVIELALYRDKCQDKGNIADAIEMRTNLAIHKEMINRLNPKSDRAWDKAW